MCGMPRAEGTKRRAACTVQRRVKFRRAKSGDGRHPERNRRLVQHLERTKTVHTVDQWGHGDRSNITGMISKLGAFGYTSRVILWLYDTGVTRETVRLFSMWAQRRGLPFDIIRHITSMLLDVDCVYTRSGTLYRLDTRA